MQYSILLTALSLSTAIAIQVTQPDNSTTWNASGDNTIKWTSVSTDPSTVNIVLVNNDVNPPVSENVATNVQVSAGSYQVSNLKGTGAGYQINLISTDSQNSGILAQSNQFTLSNSGAQSSSSSVSASSSSASASSASASAASASSTSANSASSTATGSTISTGTVTGSTSSTGTATGSSTRTGSSTATGSSTTASSTAASAAGTTVGGISMTGLALAGLFALLA